MIKRFEDKDLNGFLKRLEESDEDKFKELLTSYLDEYTSYLLGLWDGDIYENGSEEIKETILKTESPIERLFYIAVKKQADDFGLSNGEKLFLIMPQEQVAIGKKQYRVDFAIYCADEKRKKSYNIFVELNGHKYHNSSKQKVTKDRQRERALQDKCDRIMTFTGTEIFRNADECAKEVIEVLLAIMKEGERVGG